MEPVEKHVDPIVHDELLQLLSAEGGRRLSIYMPTERVWNESKQNPARLKNLLREAESQLASRGLRDSAIDELLAPAWALLDRAQFWQYQSDGLALFLSNGFQRTYRLPISFDERVVVSRGFHVRPVLQYLDGNGRFYVLALSQGGVKLYCCTRHRAEEVPIDGAPTSLPEALQYDDLEAHLDFHAGTPPGSGDMGGGIFHGQGEAGDKANLKEQIQRFFRALDNGVRNVLKREASPRPLVLAGLGYLRGLYADANKYAQVTKEGLDGNPSDCSLETLHARAWEIVAPRFASGRAQALRDYRMLAASEPERVATGVEAVVPAALYKRVDTLFVPEHGHAWGRFDATAGTVHQGESPPDAEDDLLDVALAHTLRNGGTAHVLDPTAIPDGAMAAAILRY